MGCHTWFYKKINPQPTYEEVKENVLNQFYIELDFYNNTLNGCDIDEELLSVYPEFTTEYYIKAKAITERQIAFIKKDLCKKAIYDRYSCLRLNIDSVLYVNCEYHDLFRKYTFSEDKLFSLEETLNYIEKYKDEISLFEDTFELLKEFWNKYPDGVIDFG